jgi:hypothetical protein
VLYQLSYLGPMANQAWLPVGGPQDTTGLPGRATAEGPRAEAVSSFDPPSEDRYATQPTNIALEPRPAPPRPPPSG